MWIGQTFIFWIKDDMTCSCVEHSYNTTLHFLIAVFLKKRWMCKKSSKQKQPSTNNNRDLTFFYLWHIDYSLFEFCSELPGKRVFSGLMVQMFALKIL